jgi:hypothetical protein
MYPADVECHTHGISDVCRFSPRIMRALPRVRALAVAAAFVVLIVTRARAQVFQQNHPLGPLPPLIRLLLFPTTKPSFSRMHGKLFGSSRTAT